MTESRRLRTEAERDPERWQAVASRIDPLTLPGHDRDCALAMLNQARLRGGIDEIQVEHLLAIGYRAGAEYARQAERTEQPPADRSWIEMTSPRRRWWHRYTRRNP